MSFDPETRYRQDALCTVGIGVRIGWGARLHRMGRKGVAVTKKTGDSLAGIEHIH